MSGEGLREATRVALTNYNFSSVAFKLASAWSLGT